MDSIKIGISRCLMGERVRYDGQLKDMLGCHQELAEQFELVPFCPEVEAGMGVPRPPIQIVEIEDVQYLYFRNAASSTEDFSEIIRRQVDNHVHHLQQLSGFVLMQKSPSCGIQSTPIFNENAEVLRTGAGLFVQRLQQVFPDLPIVEAVKLEDKQLRAAFIKDVITYQANSPTIQPSGLYL